jgi:pre-mRNA-processing factor 6
MADSVSGQTVVDPKGYLTDLNHVKVNSEAEVSDIKKARLLLKSVITTNPKHAPGWIAAARLEKETGKLAAARAVIMKGCELCPTNPDVWMEAAKMQTHRNAKAILAKAVRHIPTSVKIWLSAAALEETVDAKKAVLRRALELISNSVVLWKTAIELETQEDARILLGRAVEMVPQSVEMWLALARLESYERARIVLNRARQVIPTEPAIWITAAKLEEANGNEKNVDVIIQKAVKSLAAHQVVIDRDAWLVEAESSERTNSLLTCHAILKATIGIGVDDLDRKTTWLNDAENFLNKQSIETARGIYAHILRVFPAKKSVWMKAAQLEKQYGTSDSLDTLLADAVRYCPQAETLWLMSAKEKWLTEDVAGARAVLNDAFAANPDSEQVGLSKKFFPRHSK